MKTTIRLFVVLLLAALVFGGVFGFDAFRSRMIAKFTKQFANPSQTVAVATAAEQPWHDSIDATGTVRAVNGADLSTDIDGIVDEIDFRSGDDVKAGAVLLRLRTEDDAARMRQLQSAAELARANYNRDLRQLRAQAVSRATVDNDESAVHQTEASVAAQQALVAKKTLVAPFAGHLGIRQVDVGQYLAAGASIVTLQALDPIFVDFYIPQQDIAQLTIGQPVTLRVDTYPGRVFAGKIAAMNAKIDSATRTLEVRGEFTNTDHALLPGMFANVQVTIGKTTSHITLPQTAITYNPYGSTVFVVESSGTGKNAGSTARQVFVQTGATRGDQVAVLGGIARGQVIVVAGGNKLHNGTPVTVNDTVMPLDDPNPHPAEE